MDRQCISYPVTKGERLPGEPLDSQPALEDGQSMFATGCAQAVALRAKTALLEAQLNATIDGILVIDDQQRRVLINRRIVELFDVPRHILDDQNDAALLDHVAGLTKYPEKFLERIMYLYDHVNETSRDEIEFKSGMVLDRYSAPVVGKDGTYYGRIWTFRDITDRYRAREELRQSEARYRALVEHTPDIIARHDQNARCLYVNPTVERILGLTPDQVIGQTMLQIGLTQKQLPEEAIHKQVAMREAAISQVFRTRKPIQTEFDYMGVAGRTTFEWHAVPELDAAGNVVSVLSIIRDVSQRKAMEDELRAAALIDRLTGLPNRALFLDRLQQAILQHQRSNDSKYAVLFIDFDRFKTVNDSLGHAAGDQLLCQIAGRLKQAVRAVDSVSSQAVGATAARLGGDEFLILLNNVDRPENAQTVAQRIMDVLGTPFTVNGVDIVSTASIGIVGSDCGHERAEDVLRDADIAMYEAKLQGRGRAVVFDASMRDRVQRKLELESGIRKALEAGQFLLHYQPIVSLETGQVEGFEALVRWQHPEHGMISPGEFIPVAEETGLILPLGEWVFREACRQLAAWWKTLGRARVPSISVNLSRNQLVIAGLPQHFHSIAVEAGINPAAIHLEVTEGSIMSDTKLAAAVLSELKAIGFKVDMDDFGTGYSSLACLHQFPVDVLKVDRSFIANLDRGRHFAVLVNAITILARNLGIAVVAEGVETEKQIAMLQALGCPLAQGYFFARPMPAGQVIEYLAKASPARQATGSTSEPLARCA